MSGLATRPTRAQDATPLPPALATPTSIWPKVIVGILVVGYALLFGWLSLGRYYAYQMHALDMGNMAQAAWNTIHGHPFQFTNMRLPYNIEAWGTTTRLSFHVEALFPLISLVYFLYPHPESLLVLQTLALALGAVPVYLLARDALQHAWLAVVFALAYLLFPALEAMNLYEFHPVALATPLLLFAFWFAWHQRYVLFILASLAAMGTKEEIGLVVAMFGLYVALIGRNRRVGLGMAAVGTFWSLFAVLVIEHHFRQPGTLSYVHTRYGYLGHGIHGALHTILHDPGVFIQVIFTWPKLGYVERLLAPVGFSVLLAPLALLLGAPTFLIDLLSSDFHMSTGLGDNSAELIAVIMIAAILGVRLVLSRIHPQRRHLATVLLGSYLLAMALWNQHLNGYTPLGNFFQVPVLGRHQEIANRFVAMIPPAGPVSTQDQLDPHLSSRHYLYLFEDTGRPPDPPSAPANDILLDVSAPTYPLPSYQLHSYAESWIHHAGWGVAAADDGLILIKKGAHAKVPPPQFYSYAKADHARIDHHLGVSSHDIEISGYDVQHTDLPNHRIPNLAYTFYLRSIHHLHQNFQPVLFETMHGNLMGCAYHPLGLDWLPTSRWTPDHTYAVRMDPLETSWQTPGTAHLSVTLVSSSVESVKSCGLLWARHGRLWPAGSLSIQF